MCVLMCLRAWARVCVPVRVHVRVQCACLFLFCCAILLADCVCYLPYALPSHISQGKVRCTYRPYDHLDEITSAYSVAFTADGTKLYSGPLALQT